MADTHDTSKPTDQDTAISADGAVELTESQLEAAEGGAGLLGATIQPGAISRGGDWKLQVDAQKIDTVAWKVSPTAFKY